MVVLGVMRYRVMVGQQLRFAAAPVRLIDAFLGARARECGTLPLCLLLFQFFFSLLSLGDELLPRSGEAREPCLCGFALVCELALRH